MFICSSFQVRFIYPALHKTKKQSHTLNIENHNIHTQKKKIITLESDNEFLLSPLDEEKLRKLELMFLSASQLIHGP